MQLLPWSHASSAGFTLRGWHSPASGKPVLHFLHGNGYCGRVYQPLLEHLAEDFDLWLCDVQVGTAAPNWPWRPSPRAARGLPRRRYLLSATVLAGCSAA